MGLPIYLNLVNIERLTSLYYCKLKTNFKGNEINYETKWGSFSQKEDSKLTEY